MPADDPDPFALAAQFRPRLLDALRDLQAGSSNTAADRAPVTLDQQSVGRLSRMDALQGQAMAQANERRRQQRILQLQAALTRMDRGEFGYCAACGEAINPKRLAVDLAGHLCLACARGGE